MIPGWPEFKETLLARCRNPDEEAVINELAPDEAQFLMNPETEDLETDQVVVTRTMPANPNYFSGQPVIEQRLQDVEKIWEKYKHFPKAPPHIWPQREWRNAAVARPQDLDSEAGTFDQKSLQGAIKRSMIGIGKELNKIHPVLMPPELKAWLDDFAPIRDTSGAGVRQRRMLDKYSRSRGNGKRKTARAKVQIVPGEGQIYVNGKLAADYFTRIKDVENVVWPLQSLSALGEYNVWVSTWGGGTTGTLILTLSLILGQSEAIKLAVGRAMLAHDNSGVDNLYRKILRKGNFIYLLY